MANTFMFLGVTLIFLGIASFILSGGVSFTALIPAIFGIPIATFSWLAQRSASPWRWNIASAAVTLIGFAGSVRGLILFPQLVAGAEIARPVAVAAQSAMALLCFLALAPILIRLSAQSVLTDRDSRPR
jgi:hypothetical protein